MWDLLCETCAVMCNTDSFVLPVKRKMNQLQHFNTLSLNFGRTKRKLGARHEAVTVIQLQTGAPPFGKWCLTTLRCGRRRWWRQEILGWGGQDTCMSPKKIQGYLYTKDQIMSVPHLHYTNVVQILCITAVPRGHVQLMVINNTMSSLSVSSGTCTGPGSLSYLQ